MLRRLVREERQSERVNRVGWIELFGAEESVAEEEEDAADAEGSDNAEISSKTAIAGAARRGIPRR